MKGITDLSVIQYHSNGYYNDTYYLSSLREHISKRTWKIKRKENRTENNEAESSVLVELDRRSKRQKSNDNRSNKCIICGNKTFKDSKLSKNFPFCVQQNLIWFQFSPKYQSLINLMIYLQLILWVTSSAWIGNFISLKLLSITFH